MTQANESPIRTFASGATRNSDVNKLDFEGFLSPIALEAFGEYMNTHRHLEDGTLRNSDNWQKGIPLSAYMKSAMRHLIDWWREHRGLGSHEGIVWALCGVIFNAQGYLHEYLKAHPEALAQAKLRNPPRGQKPKILEGTISGPTKFPGEVTMPWPDWQDLINPGLFINGKV